MTSERIKEIQEQTAYPQSVSVMLALKQVWNECAQESYSEEEVKEILFHRETEYLKTKSVLHINEFFEQFKNKQ